MPLNFGGLLQGVIGGLSGNPFAAAAGVAGLGLELAGTASGASAGSKFEAAGQQYSNSANQYYNTVNPLYAQKTQQDVRIAGNEQKIQDVNRNYMEITNQRQQLENMRNAQKARSMATTNAAAQGGLFGSGVKGGVAGVSAQENVNSAGLGKGLEMGRSIFDVNQDTSNARIAQFGIESSINQAQTTMDYAKQQYSLASSQYNVSQNNARGLSSLGGSLINSGPVLGKLFSPVV